MKRMILIDGDIVAYQASAVTQRVFDWGDGNTSEVADLDEALKIASRTIDKYMSDLFASDYVVALSDPDANFRKGVLPTYKSNRKGVPKPVNYNAVRRYLLDEFDGKLKPGLEGDDIMGIIQTSPEMYRGSEKIIVSIDKDMQTIPGLLYNPREGEVVEITTAHAERYHLLQSVAGDIVDGYSGCPGVGMGKAIFIVDNCMGVRTYEHEFTRGARAGSTEIRNTPKQCDTVWEAIVSNYQAAKDTDRGNYEDAEQEALRQARCARILRAEDYNVCKGEVILWTPPTEN